MPVPLFYFFVCLLFFKMLLCISFMSHLHFCKDKLCCDGLWFIKKMETYFILANYLLKTTLECYTYCSPDLLKVALFTFSFSAMINECNMRNSVTNHKLCFCFALNGLWGSLYCPPPTPLSEILFCPSL